MPAVVGPAVTTERVSELEGHIADNRGMSAENSEQTSIGRAPHSRIAVLACRYDQLSHRG